MLFSSFEFLFLFLPLTWLGFRLLSRWSGTRLPIAWLTLASLFYYAWWDYRYLILLLGSDVFNYLAGRRLLASQDDRSGRLLLNMAIAINLAPLVLFKYAGFLASSANDLLHISLPVPQLVLPLAISFYTFQKIAYLVDAFRKEVPAHGFLDFILFVSFFPQLIAGPIVHHSEVMPQFKHLETTRPRGDFLSAGATLFTIGLFKKVVIAEALMALAEPGFTAASQGAVLSCADAWTAVFAYTFEIYFDFSGYSDMALGTALLFGIRLPANFYSPYRASSIIDFWRRWHMTLSRYLRDYVYIPLGGNRLGTVRRYINLMTTMALGGIWHGAGWNFLVWGVLHGSCLVINHGWRNLAARSELAFLRHPAHRIWSWPVTMLSVSIAWVYFRADSMFAAHAILKGLFGLETAGYSTAYLDAVKTVSFHRFATLAFQSWQPAWTTSAIVFIAAGIAFAFPNSMQIMRTVLDHPITDPLAIHQRLLWRPSRVWAWATAGLGSIALLSLSDVSEFIYYQF